MTEAIREEREILVQGKGIFVSAQEGGSLTDVSCSFEKGGVHGILGTFGSGKTLLLEVLAGCRAPKEGEILFKEQVCSPMEPTIKAKIGYVPKEPVFYGDMTVAETLDFIGQTRCVSADRRYRQIKEALELIGLEGLGGRLVFRLTPQEKKRLSYGGALLGNPDVLYIDEPIPPIRDAVAKREFAELVKMLGRVKTVILASTDFATVRELCQDVLILSEGAVMVQGGFEDLERQLLKSRCLRVTVKGEPQQLIPAIRKLTGVIDCGVEDTKGKEPCLRIEHRADCDVREEVSRLMGAMDAPILSMSSETLSLETVYRSLVAGGPREAEETRGKKQGEVLV